MRSLELKISTLDFVFLQKTHPPREPEVLDCRECDKEKIIKLTGFPADEVLIKGWRVEPQRIPPLVSDIL